MRRAIRLLRATPAEAWVLLLIWVSVLGWAFTLLLIGLEVLP